MTDADPATLPQFEGQEHQFLDYRQAVVHFIYSFSWDASKRSWEDLKKELLSKPRDDRGRNSAERWRERLLHERMFAPNAEMVNSYQPSLVGKSAVLERTGDVASNATLLSPIETYKNLRLGNSRKLTVPLTYTIRLFDNASGTCTFAAHLENGTCTFENIHLVLHLANNVDFGEEPTPQASHVLTNTFIQLPGEQQTASDEALWPRNAEGSYTFRQGYCSLHDLFRRWLLDPPVWAPGSTTDNLFKDLELLYTEDPKQDFQTPFVMTVSEVERNSFLRFGKSPTIEYAREVGSLLCKLTLDNRHIREHYLNLSEDYITAVLPFDKHRHGLVNLCLDRRLFFALSRRGAIAITASFSDLPSCFVIPSFLNLCEILRARWHICCLLNMELDALIDKVGTEPSPTNTELLEKMIDRLTNCRRFYLLFLRDQVPYLFDGGSITEIAKIALDELDIPSLSEAIHRKMDVLDAMRQDQEEKERQHRRDRFERDYQRVAGLVEGGIDAES